MKKKKVLYLYTLVILLPLLCYFGYSFSSKNNDERVDVNGYFLTHRAVFLDTSYKASAIYYNNDIVYNDPITSICYRVVNLVNRSTSSNAYLDIENYSFIYTYFIYIVKINLLYIALYGVLALPKVILHYVKKIGEL